MKYRAIREAGSCLKCGKPMRKGDLLMETFLGDIHARCHTPKPSMANLARKGFEQMLKDQQRRRK